MSFVYAFIKKLIDIITFLYFRKTYIVGLENIPDNDPVIICCNHANQFIDAIMIASCVNNKQVSFTMAASSFKKSVIGTFARLINAIPVKRPEDDKKKGKGKLCFISERRIKGSEEVFEGTSLESYLSYSVMIINDSNQFRICRISHIIDRFTFEIEEPSIKEKDGFQFQAKDNKEILFDFYLLPKIDNSYLFKEAFEILKKNGCICIFPEGTSHDQSNLIKLKAGIAIMTLEAMAKHTSKSIKIIPVGLNYFNRDKFRSEVIVEFGKAFNVPTEWVDEYKLNKRDTTEKLLSEIESRMKSVTLTASTYDELRTLFLLRKIYLPVDMKKKLSPGQYSELCKNFIKGMRKIKEDMIDNDNDKSRLLLLKVESYIREIEEIGITDSEVRNVNFVQTKLKRKFCYSSIWFFIYLIILFPGLLIGIPFGYYIKVNAEEERKQAKAKNPNKINANDVVSSYKLFKFLQCLPILYVIYSLLGYLVFKYCLLIEFGMITFLLLGLILFPVYIYCKYYEIYTIIYYYIYYYIL